MDVFSLAAKLTLDSKEFDSGLQDAEENGKKLESTISKAANAVKNFASSIDLRAGVDAMKQLADNAAAAGDKIDKQSQALGLSRQAYQEWDYILSQNGSSIDSLGVSMKTLTKAVVDGSETGQKAFDKLGLSIEDLRTMDMQTQFESVVKAFQEMPAGAEKSALAVDLFGRNGMQLLPLLNNTSASIDELKARAAELGIIMGDDDVNAAVGYTDAMDTLNRSVDAAKNAIGARLLPTLTDLAIKGADYVGRLTTAFKEDGLPGAISEAIDIVDDLADEIFTSFSNAADFVANIDWGSVGANIREKVVGAISRISEILSGLFTKAFDLIGAINWGNLGKEILDTILAALGGIVNGILNLFEKAVTAVTKIDWTRLGQDIWNWIITAIGSVADWFKNAFTNATERIKNIDWAAVGTAIWDFITSPIKAIGTWFVNRFTEGKDGTEKLDWTGLGNSIFTFISTAIESIGSTIVSFFSTAWADIQAIDWPAVGTAILNAITEVLSTIITWASDTFNSAADSIRSVDWVALGTDIREFIQGAIESIGEWFTSLFSEAIDETGALDWQGLGDSIFNLLSAGLEAIDGLLTGLFGDEWTQVKEDATAAWDTISSAFSDALDDIQLAWDSIVTFFTETIPQTWEDLQATAETVWTAISDAFKAALDAIKAAWDAIVSFFTETIPGVWEDLKSSATTIWEDIQKAISDPIGMAKDTLSTAWDTIKTTAETAWKALKTILEPLIQPIVDLINLVLNPIQELVGWLGDLLGFDGKRVNMTVNTNYTSNGAPPNDLNTPGASGKPASSTGSGGSTGRIVFRKEELHARSMFGGTILRGATMFGWDAQGRPQIGGGEGAEAVVGVNSLSQMIASAVKDGFRDFAAGMQQATNGQKQPIYVVLDTGELVGAIGDKMDKELERIGDWKGGGRA